MSKAIRGMAVTFSFGQGPYVLTIQVTSDSEAIDILKKLGMPLTLFSAPAIDGESVYRFPRHVTLEELKRELSGQAYALFEFLASHSEIHPNGVDSRDIAQDLGIESPALGPFVADLLKWAEQRGFKKERVIVNGRRRRNGGLSRTLRLGPLFDHAVKEFLEMKLKK